MRFTALARSSGVASAVRREYATGADGIGFGSTSPAKRGVSGTSDASSADSRGRLGRDDVLVDERVGVSRERDGARVEDDLGLVRAARPQRRVRERAQV